jgi:hypothetical protein
LEITVRQGSALRLRNTGETARPYNCPSETIGTRTESRSVAVSTPGFWPVSTGSCIASVRCLLCAPVRTGYHREANSCKHWRVFNVLYGVSQAKARLASIHRVDVVTGCRQLSEDTCTRAYPSTCSGAPRDNIFKLSLCSDVARPVQVWPASNERRMASWKLELCTAGL